MSMGSGNNVAVQFDEVFEQGFINVIVLPHLCWSAAVRWCGGVVVVEMFIFFFPSQQKTFMQWQL